VDYRGEADVLNPPDGIIDYEFYCEFNQCTAWALVTVVADDGDAILTLPAWATAANAGDGCLRYLNQTFVRDVAPGCIVARLDLIDPTAADDTLEGLQLATCTYRYACSKMNYDMILADINDGTAPTGAFSTSNGTTVFVGPTGATVHNTTVLPPRVQRRIDGINAGRNRTDPHIPIWP